LLLKNSDLLLEIGDLNDPKTDLDGPQLNSELGLKRERRVIGAPHFRHNLVEETTYVFGPNFNGG
jgi:hypothetical protein